jgi:hypothetical protein
MSQCKYCLDQIIWIAKPNGGWFPPFNSTPELRSLEYELHWNEETEDWVAAPVDKDLSVKLTPHECPVRREILARQAEEQREMETLPPPVVGTVSPPLVRTFEKVVFRNPKPEQYIKVALRLAVHCRTCGALPMEWCTYKDSDGELTVNLHTSRVA